MCGPGQKTLREHTEFGTGTIKTSAEKHNTVLFLYVLIVWIMDNKQCNKQYFSRHKSPFCPCNAVVSCVYSFKINHMLTNLDVPNPTKKWCSTVSGELSTAFIYVFV